MTLAVILAALGVGAILGSEWLARRFAPRYVLGRTLAAARHVTIDRARDIAIAGETRYVRIHGRISSHEEFPDENDRPLVYRRKRIEMLDADGRWQSAGPDVEGVPFGVESRSSFIAVDGAAVGRGLIVVPRVAEGIAGDLPAELSEGIDPQRPARLVVEQVSAVEHAFVAGVPRLSSDGEPRMTGGANRPLVLTTLELDDTMRLLGGRQRLLVFGLSGLFGTGIVLLILAVVAGVLALL